MSASSPRAKKDVGAHFDRSAPAFDAIYTGEGVSPLRRLVHRVFFHDVHWRLALTLAECDALAGASVLDIGCGSGVYLEELGRRGAGRLVGLGFPPAMIELAHGPGALPRGPRPAAHHHLLRRARALIAQRATSVSVRCSSGVIGGQPEA